ncbi:MAG: DUF362 domain-containing protein [Calditrichaeota bacterium]|nr:DUF362 domain-containing protein [Calditrichota bacterium]
MTKSKVAVIRTKPENVLPDIEKLMDMADFKGALDRSVRTILKDNISWHLFFPAANTTPWQLEGTINALKNGGYDDIVAVHNDTVVTQTEKGERLNRLDAVYKQYQIPELYNYRPEDITWERYKPQRETPALTKVYGDEILIPSYFKGTNIIHLPTVKCHIYTTTTGAMKNAFGGLLNRKRHYNHSVIHRTLVDLLIIQKEIHSGIFAVMDGTHAGDGPGPRTMRPVQKDLMLASSDQVAIDAVAAKMMGFDPMSIEYIRVAHDEGLGVGDPREIELVGEDVSGENWHFSVGDNLASFGGDLLWFSPLKSLQKLFFHTPLVKIFILASFIYHDYIWYRVKSGSTLRKFQKTEWGRLFDERYGKKGFINNEITRGISNAS